MGLAKRIFLYGILVGAFTLISYSFGVRISQEYSSVSYSSPQGSRQFFQLFFLQLGVAVAISATVFELVERAHRTRLAKTERDATQRTLGDVARTAFSSFYDDSLVQKAMSGVFATPFVRENFEMRYCFEDFEALDDVLTVDAHFRFTIKNVGQVTAEYDYIGMVSSQFAPYSNLEGRPKPEFLYLKIGENRLEESRINRLNKKIDINEPTQSYKIAKKQIKPGDDLELKGGIRLYKFRSDSEVFRTFYPSDRPTIIVQNNTTENLYFDLAGIGEISEPSLEKAPEDQHRYEATIEDTLLPYYGWVLSWVDLNKFKPN